MPQGATNSLDRCAFIRNVAATCCKQISQQMMCTHKNQLVSITATLLLLLLLTTQTSTMGGSGNNTQIAKKEVAERECGSMDVRNECDSFLHLQGCTVIKGYLLIVLLPKTMVNNTIEICDFKKYSFPELREITEYLIFHDVTGLTSISEMFPNLTVIRGRRLFLNYALSISGLPDFEEVQFKSLIAIQRGHVFIGSCPRLCNLEKINWDRLTLARGENHIFPTESNTCKAKTCNGCPNTDYCWTDMSCQKFENDNLQDLKIGLTHCHPQCLGGCFEKNDTKEGCRVCRNLTDHGACVAECPADKYLLESHQRCYTKEECTKNFGLLTHNRTCVTECPYGFIAEKVNSTCIACPKNQTCIKYCGQVEPFPIYNLADADRLSGCQVLNGSLIITIRNKVNERDLAQSLAHLQEIRGHLKISRSRHLTSLMFLQNLKKISGQPLESDLYAIILYDNKNLTDLWNGTSLELPKGSMYIHQNNKLCNRRLRAFSESVVHDESNDSLQENDQEVFCDPTTLALSVENVSSNTLTLTWRKDQTFNEIEILYKPVTSKEEFTDDSELDSNVCERIIWQRQLNFKSELQGNATHYSVQITGLKPFTQYACFLKTFDSNVETLNSRSMVKFPCTTADKPTPPLVAIVNKTETSLTLQLSAQNTSWELINYYRLKVYEHPYDKRLLDKRNFCNQPSQIHYLDIPQKDYANSKENEDFNDCCARQEEANEDRHFISSMRAKFTCHLNADRNCDQNTTAKKSPLYNKKLKTNEVTYTISELKVYSLYTLQLFACNDEVGCGTYTLLSANTNYSKGADKLRDLHACRIHDTTVYLVNFTEPAHPNGVILSYVIRFRKHLLNAKTDSLHLRCVTRLEHETAKYRYVVKLNATYNQVSVMVHSLAGDVSSNWVNVSQCILPPGTKFPGIDLSTSDGGDSHGVNIFLICFLLGAGGTLLWICYKRRYWRLLPEWRRYLPLHYYRRATAPNDDIVDDRQLLVDSFERVLFHNNPDDDY